jgi:hypothetical protein
MKKARRRLVTVVTLLSAIAFIFGFAANASSAAPAHGASNAHHAAHVAAAHKEAEAPTKPATTGLWYLKDAAGAYAYYDTGQSLWRAASPSKTQVGFNCLNQSCLRFEIQIAGTSQCMQYVSGTGVNNAACTGNNRQTWQFELCADGTDYGLHNLMFDEYVHSSGIPDDLTLETACNGSGGYWTAPAN